MKVGDLVRFVPDPRCVGVVLRIEKETNAFKDSSGKIPIVFAEVLWSEPPPWLTGSGAVRVVSDALLEII